MYVTRKLLMDVVCAGGFHESLTEVVDSAILKLRGVPMFMLIL